MKKFMLSLVAMIVCTIALAQNEYKKPPTFGFHFTLSDFQSAAYVRKNGLADAFKNNEMSKVSDMASGLAISYSEGFNNYLDFNATLTGSYLAYPIPDKVPDGQQNLLLELAATANLKLTSDNYWLVPYLTAGIGASKYKGYYGAFVPLGVGLQFKILPSTFILVNAQYRIPATQNVAYHFYYGIGIAQSFAKKVPPPPAEVVIPAVVVVDKDGDGVLDVNDKCPDIPGLANLQGCPDKDGDGIADAEDKCPTVPGLAKYQGCPIPDTDGDGINDEEDKCITVPGVARYQGCPIPDTDGDSLNDEVDKCPNVAGPADNYGCPIIGIKSFEIAFKTGSAVLLPKAKPILDTVVAYLNRHQAVNVYVDGYTDNTGSDKVNDPLSVKRAEATKAYIVSKGIDAHRMTTAGYGSKNPVADNNTAAGRTKNRRIEIRIHE